MAYTTIKKVTIALLFFLLCGRSYPQNIPPAKASEEATGNERSRSNDRTMEIACRLTAPELRERKETIIASLKKQILEKKELQNGYAFRFAGTDQAIDELAEFIKTERECCSFFTFRLIVSGNKSETWLELTGPAGVKDMITTEIGF